LERGLDPAGSAGDFDDALVVEIPLPWKQTLYYDDSVMPPEMRALRSLWDERYAAGFGYPHRLVVIAPDQAYSREGYRRVMHYTRPKGLFAHFEKVEYHIPFDQFGALVWSLYEDRAALPTFEPYRVPDADRLRDLLVCTHGSIDAACSRFGYPLFKHLRTAQANASLRVWRASHFGGHVFAPTLIDMPSAHYWAYIEAQQAEHLIRRTGEVALLRGHYRGWAGVPYGFAQAAERELWQTHGWSWFDYPKAADLLAQDADTTDPKWAEVRIMYQTAPDSAPIAVDLHVEVSHTIETPPSTNDLETYAYPQYRAALMEKRG
jgi:hypothetical protein